MKDETVICFFRVEHGHRLARREGYDLAQADRYNENHNKK